MTAANVRQLKRRPAKRPVPRTVEVAITDGEFTGWAATAKADFPAKWLVDLQSSNVERILEVLDLIVVDHNMPNVDDEIAATMADVDPYSGLMLVAGEIFDALAKLPNR